MASENKVILLGRLGSDPEVRYTPGGTAVCKLSLATSRKYTDKQGQKQEKTAWHKLVAWGKLAEICGKYLKKGAQIYTVGYLDYGSYEKDGVKHYTTDIVMNELVMLGSPSGASQDAGAGWTPPAGAAGDDIPF